MNKTPIQQFIHLFRIQQVKSNLYRGLIQLSIGTIISILFLSILESIYYFSIANRQGIAKYFLFLFFVFFLYIILRAYLNAQSTFNNSNNHSLALLYKDRNLVIGDRLLNAFQLEESIDKLKTGKDLATHAIDEMNADLGRVSSQSLYDPIPNQLKKTLTICICFTMLVFLFLLEGML